ncbi:AGE family epimerase/isomerase [Pedobacter sp. CFBP9032]|uniref:AGE family epimerase/isomerase n=1 Tax=Pedobacter sp. CFBP9032 TaxID=3096539 RepID=UPI002A6ACCCF|nr:AGE family epimerase/isomerase [Pedobacter sp. CFBP9032]MDY0905027.1 AGE family epimerase/isomerase [Pedobacter sp. CFBP9032]
MKVDLAKYQQELNQELDNILSFWKNFTIDEVNGGFVGKIDHNNHIDEIAPKGSVLNARILWTFSASYNLKKNPGCLLLADRAFAYIKDHFVDQEFGGVYWMLDAKGKPLDTKKQVYAVAFTIYALSEYFIASKFEQSKNLAISLYTDLLAHSYDQQNGGYFEAFSRDWKALEDLRLSNKDANEKKTMNTHLHVLEAFTTLYRIWPDEQLKNNIIGLIDNFTSHILNKKTGNLILFLDENWNQKSDIISYGHDIEAAWLLLEAAEALHDQKLIDEIKILALQMATISKNGIDIDGSLWYEFDPSNHHFVKEKHWWVQAEAMVGFFNAWQISGNESFLQISLNNWAFVKSNIIDHQNGEWFWGITETGEIMNSEDKVGPWKCPYHNSRACIELIRRIGVGLSF